MKKTDFLFLLISGVMLTIAWVTFNIIHHAVASTITSTVSEEIAPIESSFDTKTLASLKNRTIPEPVFNFQFSTPSGTPTVTVPSVSIKPTISITLFPSLTQQATQGGIKSL